MGCVGAELGPGDPKVGPATVVGQLAPFPATSEADDPLRRVGGSIKVGDDRTSSEDEDSPAWAGGTLPSSDRGHDLLSKNDPISLAACRTRQQDFADLVCLVVEKMCKVAPGIEPWALIVRTLLHLPRMAGRAGTVSPRQVHSELLRCARHLLEDQANVRHRVPARPVELRELTFVADESEASTDIFDSLHYLRNARAGSVNYALVDDTGRPVTLCSVSPLEWTRVGKQLTKQFGLPIGSVRDVSRVFSFDSAPPNAISYLLSRVRKEIRKSLPEVELLSTAVDPNLGFTGASYQAANWHRWMTIKARPYMYFDQDYITPRQLRAELGTTNVDALKSAYGKRFKVSQADLLDSMIFCCRVKAPTEHVPPAQQRRLYR